MTDLQMGLALANEITRMKIEAVKNKTYQVTFEVFGKPRTQYYYSLRWHDNPSKMEACAV
jgi:hypothetical protein